MGSGSWWGLRWGKQRKPPQTDFCLPAGPIPVRLGAHGHNPLLSLYYRSRRWVWRMAKATKTTGDDPYFAAFVARPRADFERLGLAAEQALVALHQGSVIISVQGKSVSVDLANVERVRIGYVEGKSIVYFEMELWLAGGIRLSLTPAGDRANYDSYGRFARQLAHRLADLHGTRVIERGTSFGNAMFAPVLFGLLFAAGSYSSLVREAATAGMARWIGMIVTSIPLAIVLWLFFFRHRPRRIRSLDELEGQLPR
jgi:hypothetical protein